MLTLFIHPYDVVIMQKMLIMHVYEKTKPAFQCGMYKVMYSCVKNFPGCI